MELKKILNAIGDYRLRKYVGFLLNAGNLWRDLGLPLKRKKVDDVTLANLILNRYRGKGLFSGEKAAFNLPKILANSKPRAVSRRMGETIMERCLRPSRIDHLDPTNIDWSKFN